MQNIPDGAPRTRVPARPGASPPRNARAVRPPALRASPEPIPASEAPPPSAALSVPVYSLVTGGDAPTANIVTYCSPVALKPDRVLAIGLYRGTLSLENADRDRRGVLQILGLGPAAPAPGPCPAPPAPRPRVPPPSATMARAPPPLPPGPSTRCSSTSWGGRPDVR